MRQRSVRDDQRENEGNPPPPPQHCNVVYVTSSLLSARSVSSFVPPAEARFISSNSFSAFAFASEAASLAARNSASMLVRKSASVVAARSLNDAS